jgi:CheY-like chemotaxis protein
MSDVPAVHPPPYLGRLGIQVRSLTREGRACDGNTTARRTNGLTRTSRIRKGVVDIKRLILIHDNAIFLEAFALLLEHETGLECIQAESVAQARRIVGRPHGEVDLAIVNIALPDGDAIPLIRELQEAGRDVAVLALVADRNLAGYAHVLQAGADQVVSLAAPLEELMDAVSRLEDDLRPWPAI